MHLTSGVNVIVQSIEHCGQSLVQGLAPGQDPAPGIQLLDVIHMKTGSASG
jgi:hypothetical protein